MGFLDRIGTAGRRRHGAPRLLGAPALAILLGCGGGGAPAPAAPPTPVGVPASAGRLAVSEAPAYFTVVADSIPGDPGVEAMVAPFRARMGDRINEVIGEAADPLSKAWPEGTLGNFAADAILEAARKRMAEPVHLALANNGGLRVPVPRGPVTVGKMFELMPFENMVAVVTLTGAQLQGLAREVALRGGEPVAGWSFRIEMEGDARVPRDLRVGGEPVDPKALYRLATSDYLANGGDELPSLTRAAERRDLPLLVRDALIEFVRERGVIRYGLEGRITGEVRR